MDNANPSSGELAPLRSAAGGQDATGRVWGV
jgi:hypothetical protein